MSSNVILLVGMFALLWVLLIRPQRQRQQKQQLLLKSIAPGDEVLTVGGLYGIVREIDEEDDLIVEVAEGIQVRIARRAIGGVVKPEANDAEDDDADDEIVDDADADNADQPDAADADESVEDAHPSTTQP